MEPEDVARYIYEEKLNGRTYNDISIELDLTYEAVVSRCRRYYRKNKIPAPMHVIDGREIQGSVGEQPHEAPEDLWSRAISVQERQEKTKEWKSERRVIYDKGPVVLVFMADLHLGSSGTDYRAIDRDIVTIKSMVDNGAQVGVVLLGDLVDNFIIGRLRDLRMNNSPFLAIEEWGLVDYALERLAPYLIGSVAGNHDNWSWLLVGVDILHQRHRELNDGILYDPLELAFTLQVSDFECRVMCRHDWRGHSMFNPTHGLEHGHHRLGREFDIGAGAHTHRGGLAREFANGHPIPGHALICGTYKKTDTYALAKGYPPPLNTSAVATVIDEDGIAWSTSQLWRLVKYL